MEPGSAAQPATASAEAVDALCRAAGVAATPAQAAALARFLDLLERWNAIYNLSALRDRAAMLSHHIADCVAAVPALRRQAGDSGRILDVGSGGGLPGVVIATLMPGQQVTCLDAVGKKAAFVRHVAGALQLPNLAAVHARVETWQTSPQDLIVSRAFASLTDFTRLTARLLAPGGTWLAMKGRVPDDEIERLGTEASGAEVFHVEHLGVPLLDAERCLVWMRPRAPGRDSGA